MIAKVAKILAAAMAIAVEGGLTMNAAPFDWPALPFGEPDGAGGAVLLGPELEPNDWEEDEPEDKTEEEEEEEEEGRGENERETFGLATLQNSWDTLSADPRSPRHWDDTQEVMSCTKRVELWQ